MSAQRPVIQQIRDRFDHFGDTIGDRSTTSSIKITPRPDGYAVTSYPNGTYGFEGFTLDVRVPQGMFNEAGPTRVELSREKDGLMRFSIQETAEEQGMMAIRGAIEPAVARESLMLPGDPGFELFDQLHAELAARRTVVADAIGTLGVILEPTSFTYHSQVQSAGRYDHQNRIATHERKATLEVSGMHAEAADHMHASIELDGSQTAPMPDDYRNVNWPPEYPMVFRAGTIGVGWATGSLYVRRELGDESLMAFAALHANFATLYR
jgi:hypothetical protein